MEKPEKIKVIYTVPLHCGSTVLVPSYAKVIFYDWKKAQK